MIATAKNVLTVSQLTSLIKQKIEPAFQNICVQGEISNFRHQSSGHIYFSLKDASSQISAVLFRGNSKNLSRIPKAGDKVILRGEISIYSPRGSYQIIVRELSFLGVGELLLKLHELKEKLKKQGWMDKDKKKDLPSLPKTIGIVTSPTGAVIQDILNVLFRRFSGLHLILYPVQVQGEKAKEEIATAIQNFNHYNLADVLIVGRGGGSMEDLWPFSEEIVAEAIFSSKIPIISAVGHETDYSISDLVADVRAPTPSAAAEIVIAEKVYLQQKLHQYSKQIEKNILHHLTLQKNRLKSLSQQSIFSSSFMHVEQRVQQIDEIKNYLDIALLHKLEKCQTSLKEKKKLLHSQSPLQQIQWAKEKLFLLTKRLSSSILTFLERRKEKIKNLSYHLFSIDPKNLLKKGYSILFSEKTGSIILSRKQIEKKQKILALVSDGKIIATVEETHGK